MGLRLRHHVPEALVTHVEEDFVDLARLRADAHIQPGSTAPLAFNLSKAVFFDPATEQRIV